MHATLADLIPLSEAAAMLPRKRGKKVHIQTIRRWGNLGWFKVIAANGWKVRRSEFLAWAMRTGRLPCVPDSAA